MLSALVAIIATSAPLPDGPNPPAPANPPAARADLIPDRSWIPRPGDIATVYSRDGLDAPGADTRYTLELLAKSGKANDSTGVRELLSEGRLTMLANLTQVRVIDRDTNPYAAGGMNILEIRVEDGEHRDKKVWITEGSVSRLIPRPQPAPEMIPGSALPRGKVKAIPKRLPPRPVDPATRAAATLQLGKNTRFQGNRAAAIEYFRRAIREAPESPAAKEAAKILKDMGATP